MSEAFTYMITHIHSALAHFLHIRCVVYVCFSIRYEDTNQKNRPFGLCSLFLVKKSVNILELSH